MKNTYEEIANSEALWDDYADPDGTMPFDESTFDERMILMSVCFGPEDEDPTEVTFF